ncbi:MAG: trypsin-like peptidase domain-containing protein [Lachnospiraceae bacterium]|nr:trypsin-like peptidase domain-containing protein [Lachnospiraceae bacterium]
MKKWRSFALCASLAAAVGILGAGAVTYEEWSPGIRMAGVTEETEQAPAAAKTALKDRDDEKEPGSVEQTVLGSTTENNTEDMSVKDVAASSMPAMVAITNTSVQSLEDYFGGQGGFGGFGGFGGGNGDQGIESVSMGTGIIIAETDDQILIATNAHVVSGARDLSVAFVDETAAEAAIVGTDVQNDLAVISVKKADISDETESALKISPVGSSSELSVGESVVAIGNALGYGQSVSTGIVSALNRPIETQDEMTGETGTTAGMIQTDASINPGNSGGALLNMKGQLIGINSAKYADEAVEGMGYAIPIDYAEPILTDLANGTHLTEDTQDSSAVEEGDGDAYLGISCTTITNELAETYHIPTGVYVRDVEQGSSADAAGIKAGDIITSIGGTKIASTEELQAAIRRYHAGDRADVDITREAEGAFGNGYASGTVTVVFGTRNENLTA